MTVEHPATQPPYQPNHAPQPAPSAGLSIAKNPLGLVSAIAGASGFLFGFFFTLIQFVGYATQNLGGLDLLGIVHTVFSALLGICAIVLGILALRQTALPKTLAAVGIALGGALIVEFIGSLVYTIGLPLLYR